MRQFAPKIVALSDSDVTCFYLDFFLAEKGYHVEIYKDLDDYSSQARWELPDLFILESANFQECLSNCSRLRRNPRRDGIPILVLHQQSKEFDKGLLLHNGADDVLEAPFSPDHLSIHVNNLLFPSPAVWQNQIQTLGAQQLYLQ